MNHKETTFQKQVRKFLRSSGLANLSGCNWTEIERKYDLVKHLATFKNGVLDEVKTLFPDKAICKHIEALKEKVK
tara:strand:- start:4996 stop:5220 length:225 start_codon:yes stop_codon:yes gene_type:complete